MKTFIKKCVFFVLVECILLGGIFVISSKEPYRAMLMHMTNSELYDRAPSEEIIPYIDKVEKDLDAKKLIVGDSVCHQLFTPFVSENEEYCIAGSNQAVTMIGQYLLIRDFLEHHGGATDVYLILTSMTGSGLDNSKLAYQYLITPFAETGVLEKVTEDTKKDFIDIYGAFYMKPDVIRFIDYSPIAKKLYLNTRENVNYNNMPMSFQYFELILELGEQYNAKIHLLHGPMRESLYEDMQAQKEIDLGACLSDQMREKVEAFYQSLTYYPDEYFKDGVHFGTEYSNKEQLALYIGELVKQDESLADFVLLP